MWNILPGPGAYVDPVFYTATGETTFTGRYVSDVITDLAIDFIRTRPGESLLELGAGNGVISLLLGRRPFARLLALELQPGLADLARRNVSLNGLEARITVIEADLRTFRPTDRSDVVFSNPPYIRKLGGHLCLSGEKSIAKHEIRCDISDIMQAPAAVLKPDGRGYFVYPAARRGDFDAARERSGLRTRTLRLVHSRPGGAPRWMLAECDFSAPGDRGPAAAAFSS